MERQDDMQQHCAESTSQNPTQAPDNTPKWFHLQGYECEQAGVIQNQKRETVLNSNTKLHFHFLSNRWRSNERVWCNCSQEKQLVWNITHVNKTVENVTLCLYENKRWECTKSLEIRLFHSCYFYRKHIFCLIMVTHRN